MSSDVCKFITSQCAEYDVLPDASTTKRCGGEGSKSKNPNILHI